MSKLVDPIENHVSVLEHRLQIEHLGSPRLLPNTDDGQDIIQGLSQAAKTLPSRYFYDDKGSQLFEQICELPEYYPTRTEAWILQQYASEIAQQTGACELVELGSGSSTKTHLLLDAYEQQEFPLHYVPIDVSGGILEESAKQLLKDYPTLKVKGKVGTYQQALSQLNPTSLPRRMVFFLGSSLGNFSPQECDRFLAQITTSLEAGDYFLLGVDLQKPQEILEAAYNDSRGVNAAFNLNIIAHLNWRFWGNFDLSLFRYQAIFDRDRSQIEMYLHCQKSHSVRLEKLELTVDFEAGESIRTEISRKFNLEQMQKNLQEVGLQPIKTWTDPKQWFGLMLFQVS